MIQPTRGVARAVDLQWRRLASSSARPSLRQPGRVAAPKDSPVARPYKPTPPKKSSRNAPPPPPPPPPTAETLLDHWRTAWLPLSGAALLAGFLGFYIFGTTTASLRASAPSSSTSPSPPSSACAAPCEHSTPTGRPPALTGDNAEQFDKELNLPEWWMGVTSLRKRLAAAATGHVLEVAVGSGRNLEHYNWDALSAAVALAEQRASGDERSSGSSGRIVRPPGIASFTGLDISIDMLDVARRKLAAAVPPLTASAPIVRAASFASPSTPTPTPTPTSTSTSTADSTPVPNSTSRSQISFLDGHVRLIAADAHDALPRPARADGGYYDTVTQTFGLCSVRDPTAVLANLAAAVRPDTGRIILLEHGRGWYGLVNGLLDRNADKHFAKYGCWWNRDIEALVEEAVRSTPGLEIVRVERPKVLQMGTLVWIELRVAADKLKRT